MRGAWFFEMRYFTGIFPRMESVDHLHHVLWSTDSFAHVCIDNVAMPSRLVAWLIVDAKTIAGVVNLLNKATREAHLPCHMLPPLP